MTGNATSDTGAESKSKTDSAPIVALPDIAALFRTRVVKYSEQPPARGTAWYLWRTGDSVEIFNPTSQIGELWERLKGKDVAFTWLYHARQYAVQYSPSDLRSIENKPDWDAKSHLISPALLSRLEKTGQTMVLGYHAERYEGRIGEYELALTWIPKLSIPAFIRQKTDQQVSEVVLDEVYTYKRAPWKPIPHDDYDAIDFADLGDNEAHPVVRLLQHNGVGLSTIQYPFSHH